VADLKPKLLVLELWGVGDLALATPFLRAAAERFTVTLLARPHAKELQPRLWPEVRVIPFTAPWTAFRGKYRLHAWPWAEMRRLLRGLREHRFDAAVSARHDPRDHVLLWRTGSRLRAGSPRLGSGVFLTESLKPPPAPAHRYDCWRLAGRALGLDLPARAALPPPTSLKSATIVLHTGAGQPVRVWPLEGYSVLRQHLRGQGCEVRVLCDADQLDFWRHAGEPDVESPASLGRLIEVLDGAGAFIGNDSGPGHLAAALGVPTFTIFGPQLPGLFLPVHPAAEYAEGGPCPFKPCFDHCRFSRPKCIEDLSPDTLIPRIGQFVMRHVPAGPTPPTP
jgi:ADP-heptose:LPS heptosyltransferase